MPDELVNTYINLQNYTTTNILNHFLNIYGAQGRAESRGHARRDAGVLL